MDASANMTPDPAASTHMPRHGIRSLDELQQLTQLAAALSGCSTLLIHLCQGTTITLITGRQWEPSAQDPEIPFCRFALSQPEPTVIEDADRHPEWASSPLVAGPWHFKFLAGFPIRGKQGELMGLLTLLDPQNLHLDSAVLQALGIVARQAASAILLGCLLYTSPSPRDS